jgi:hypothetical protein
MHVYTPGTDHFDPEYLAYLGTLTSQVALLGDDRVRVTKNPRGEVVRIEYWTAPTGYLNLQLPGWMNP